jgi:hypothetical protein
VGRLVRWYRSYSSGEYEARAVGRRASVEYMTRDAQGARRAHGVAARHFPGFVRVGCVQQRGEDKKPEQQKADVEMKCFHNLVQ